MAQQFGDFTASELYCPHCRQSQPVRERLLLVLPTGELYEYLCSQCGASLGERSVSGPQVQAPPTERRARSRPPRHPHSPPQPPRRLLR